MPSDYAAIEEAVRALIEAAGVPGDQVVINRRGKPVLVLPLHDGREKKESDHGRRVSQIPLDILSLLREVGKPLTCYAILEEFAKRDVPWSQRSVEEHLAKLVKDGILDNPESARPRGYRLADADPPPAK